MRIATLLELMTWIGDARYHPNSWVSVPLIYLNLSFPPPIRGCTLGLQALPHIDTSRYLYTSVRILSLFHFPTVLRHLPPFLSPGSLPLLLSCTVFFLVSPTPSSFLSHVIHTCHLSCSWYSKLRFALRGSVGLRVWAICALKLIRT